MEIEITYVNSNQVPYQEPIRGALAACAGKYSPEAQHPCREGSVKTLRLLGSRVCCLGTKGLKYSIGQVLHIAFEHLKPKRQRLASNRVKENKAQSDPNPLLSGIWPP